MALRGGLEGWHTLASYLFVFALDPGGVAQPVLPVGWTLNYEMFFYAVMAVVLLLRLPMVVTVTVLLVLAVAVERSEEHTSDLQSLMRTSYAAFCLTTKNNKTRMH